MTLHEPVERSPERIGIGGYFSALLAVLIATAIGLATFRYTTLAEIIMLYLIAIMAASLLGRGPSLVATSLAVVAFDFCFVPPRFTFAVADAHYLLTFAVMFGCGAIISTLVVRLRQQQRVAVARERRTAALQAFTRDVAEARTVDDVATVLARHLEDHLGVAGAVLIADDRGELIATAGLAPLTGDEIATAAWALQHRTPAVYGAETQSSANSLFLPLVAGDAAVGVLAARRRANPPWRSVARTALLDAVANQAALAIARVQMAKHARDAELRARAEELRSSLLSAVSHDLRTPLAVITGAATSLRDHRKALSEAAVDELIASIVADASRLERVLSNLLQLTRVETGLQPAREWVPADEVVGSALTWTEAIRRGATIETSVPADLQLWVDPVLFEQVLINLLENAVKHGRPPYAVCTQRTPEGVVIEVSDCGSGLPAGDASRLFEKFVRGSAAPGVGLGLAVARAIVEAHGGHITAANRPEGGALFRIELPMPNPPPELEVA